MKQLKDYIHHYIGCEVQNFNEESGKLIGVEMPNTAIVDPAPSAIDNIFRRRLWSLKAVKPILRRLGSMTEDEDQRQFREANRGHYIDMHWYPEGFAWLLEKRFDLFGLIDAGLAIDAATLEGGQQQP